MGKLALVSLAMALTGCTSVYLTEGDERFISTQVAQSRYKASSTNITFVTLDHVVPFCSKVTGKRHAVACAVWSLDHSKCTIYTAKNTDSAIVGHEIRHCFEGNFHH